jgi:hypothetical protein
MIVFLLFILGLVGCLLGIVINRARRLHWSLLEGLIATAILGHVIVLPVAYYLRNNDLERALSVAVLSVAIAAGMAWGMLYALHNLSAINEQRSGIRISYLILGLLFVPSLIAIPYNIVLGWLIWLPLLELRGQAAARREVLLQAQRQELMDRIWKSAPSHQPAQSSPVTSVSPTESVPTEVPRV